MATLLDLIVAVKDLEAAADAKNDADARFAAAARKVGDLIAALSPDPRLAAEIDSLVRSRDALAAAVEANTPHPAAATARADMNPTGNPDIDALAQQIVSLGDVIQSAVTLLTKLSDLIKQNANDPVALHALADSVKQNADTLAAAVVANTPADPNNPPAPTPNPPVQGKGPQQHQQPKKP